MNRTYDEINDKIKNGQVAVFTAEEAVNMAKEMGVKEAAKKVDVVTCATFGPMCSSGAFLNFGHTDPRIRMCNIWLNDVPCSGGMAAVDTYVGATQLSESLGFAYGGAHVIEDLIAGKSVRLRAESYGTDCYPLKSIEMDVTLEDLNQAYLYNPRNCYQNYPAVTNPTNKTIKTYMGTLLPNYGNVTYSTSGELSPLLKDPKLRCVGVGTKIFLGGAQGMVMWEGTQHVLNHTEYDDGHDYNGATIAVAGDLKAMNSRYIRGATFDGYGVTMYVGMGIPMPVLDDDMFYDLSRPNSQLYTSLYDYSTGGLKRPVIKHGINYEELRSGSININGKKVRTAPVSSLALAREIAGLLKDSVKSGDFTLQKPIMDLPKDSVFKSLMMD